MTAADEHSAVALLASYNLLKKQKRFLTNIVAPLPYLPGRSVAVPPPSRGMRRTFAFALIEHLCEYVRQFETLGSQTPLSQLSTAESQEEATEQDAA